MRHKVFLSYYHAEDQQYKRAFEREFSEQTIPKSVGIGDVMPENSADYIKRLIREDFISDSSIVVVLVGPNTWRRKHVDWEIYAGLDPRSEGISGLVGVLLPRFPLTSENKYSSEDLPARLADNVKSQYAPLVTWQRFTRNATSVRETLDTAFARRKIAADRVRNGRKQLGRNL